jgi:hypothetical protein
MSDNRTWAPAVLLAIVIICGTVLTALRVVSTSELLPLLGGAIVVVHRMLDTSRHVSAPSAPSAPSSWEPETPTSKQLGEANKTKAKITDVTGASVVAGMVGGGAVASALVQFWG